MYNNIVFIHTMISKSCIPLSIPITKLLPYFLLVTIKKSGKDVSNQFHDNYCKLN